MVGWHHRLNGHEFEQALGDGDGQGGLVCYSPWGHKELDTTEWLNWTELKAFDYVDYNRLWKIQEMGISDYLICLLRHLYAGQEAIVRTGHGTKDWLKTGKGVCQGCVLLPCLFNLHAEYIMWSAGLDKAQARVKIAGRNINNLRYVPPLWQKAKN